MKNKVLIGLMSLFLVMGVYQLTVSQVEVDYMPDVMAAAQTTTPSVACTDPTIAAFQGDLDYTITWSAAVAGSAATPSSTAALSSGVNGESAPTVTATLNAAGAPAGSVVLTSLFPGGKQGGMQCQINVDDLKLEAHGDGTDNTLISMYARNVADADNSNPAVGDQIDNAAATAKDVLFGALGQISTTLFLDGTRDTDGAQNGEIGWGTATESNGGMDFSIVIDTIEYNVTAGTDVETLTLTGTGS